MRIKQSHLRLPRLVTPPEPSSRCNVLTRPSYRCFLPSGSSGSCIPTIDSGSHYRRALADAIRLPPVPTMKICRSFSTETKHATQTSPFSLKRMIRPFLLKCHPDVQESDAAKMVNLTAVQNLNSYLDTVKGILSSEAKKTREPSSRLYEIDFMVALPERKGSTGQPVSRKEQMDALDNTPIMSRRKIELVLPPVTVCRRLLQLRPSDDSTELRLQIQRHVILQLSRLLKMAGLPLPSHMDIDFVGPIDDWESTWAEALNLEDDEDVTHQNQPYERQRFRFEPDDDFLKHRERRERFVRNINWKRFEELYKKALARNQAGRATLGLVADNPVMRQAAIADILGKVRLKEPTDVLTQVVAIRRLSLLLEESFEELQIEQYGRVWENCVFILGPPRPYNTSSAALRKRRRKGLDTGFSFTLHDDSSVSVEIPIDFQDQELIRELDRNFVDLYETLVSEDGFNSIFSF